MRRSLRITGVSVRTAAIGGAPGGGAEAVDAPAGAPQLAQNLPCISVPQLAQYAMPQWDLTGGEGEIRTPGTREGSTVFETAAIDHSATSPQVTNVTWRGQPARNPSPD